VRGSTPSPTQCCEEVEKRKAKGEKKVSRRGLKGVVAVFPAPGAIFCFRRFRSKRGGTGGKRREEIKTQYSRFTLARTGQHLNKNRKKTSSKQRATGSLELQKHCSSRARAARRGEREKVMRGEQKKRIKASSRAGRDYNSGQQEKGERSQGGRELRKRTEIENTK